MLHEHRSRHRVLAQAAPARRRAEPARTGRSRRGLASLASLAALAGLPAAGCVDSGVLVIVKNQVPGDGCMLTPTVGGLFRSSGTFDVALDRPRPYLVFPVVESRLPKLADDLSPSEPNDVRVKGVRVRLTPPRSRSPVVFDAGCPLAFDWPASGVIGPGDLAVYYVEGMRPCHSAALRAAFESGAYPSDLTASVYFNVEMRVFGRRGTDGVESDPFVYPVRVCYGCLQTGFSDPDLNFENGKDVECKSVKSNPYTGNPCNPAQDFGPVLCCVDDSSRRICPAPGMETTPIAP